MSGNIRPLMRVVSAVALSVIVLAAMAMAVGKSSAEVFPKEVRGFVWDSEGRAVEGADVVVTVKDGETERVSYSETTSSIGFYSLTVAPDKWDEGNTIEVVAEFNGKERPNSTVATLSPLQWVNVTFTFEIPEFGGMTGLLVTGGLLGAVAVVALVYFRKR